MPKKKLLSAILFSIVLLVVVLVFILDYRRSSVEVESLSGRSQQRLLSISELSTTLKDAQRSHVGFITTHREEFLANYESAAAIAQSLLTKIASGLEHREQAALADSLALKLNEMMRNAQYTIDQVHGGRYDDAVSGTEAGRALPDEITAILARLEKNEREFMQSRKDALARRATLIFGVVVSGILISYISLLISLTIIYRDRRKIQYLNTQVDESNQELGISNTALMHANEQLQRANEALQKANLDLNDFTYSISHDLKAPLRVISGYCEMLMDDDVQHKLDEKEKKLLTVIQESTSRMQKLINDLLELSRLGNTPLAKQDFDMRALVDEVLKEKTLKPGTKLTVLPMEEARGDPALLRQVWENLVSNAIKFSSKSDDVEIEIGYQRDGVGQVYWVKDSGVGFDPAYGGKLFKVFSRLHGKKDFEGTGAGLAIVKKIVDAHGGKTWAESEPFKGAVFYFTLPLR